MKLRLSIMILSLITALSSWGEPVKLESFSPTSGEAVSNLDVKLIFDIEEAAISIDWVDLCCLYGKLTFSYYTGYGTDNQVLLASKDVACNGKTEGASYSRLQQLYVPAPNEIKVVEGENYTITMTGTASLSKIGSAAYKTTVKLTFNDDDMLVMSCVGTKADPQSFYLVNSSLDESVPQVKIPEITLNFSQPVSIIGNRLPYINKGTTLFATATAAKVKDDDPCSIVLLFGEEQLWKGSYTVVIPEGFVCQENRPDRLNNPIELALTGEYLEYFSYKTTKPEINGIGLEENYFIEFDMQNDLKIGTTPVKADVYLYENEVSEENLCGTFAVELRGSSFFPHELEIPISYKYKPATKYIFVLPQGVITLQSKYSNARIEIPFTTPSIENSGFAPIEFVAYDGKFTNKVTPSALKDNMELSQLNIVDLAMTPRQYKGEWNLTYTPAEDSKITEAILYDITSGDRKELKRMPLSRVKRETLANDFYVLTIEVNANLYAGHEYELVIPTKETGVASIIYNDFITKSDEYIIKLKGCTPVGEPNAIACSLNDNQELKALHVVHWTFPTGFKIANDESKARVELSETDVKDAWLSLTSDSDGSYLTAIFNDRRNGNPVMLEAGQEATVVLPEGSIVFADLPDEVCNDEIRLIVRGENSVIPQTVNVEVIASGLLTSSSKTLKGEPYELKFTPDENWKVSKLRCNDEDVTEMVINGMYKIASLVTDIRFEVELSYMGEIIVADESDIDVAVAEITDAGIKIYKDGDSIILQGTKAGDNIIVYTLGGQQITTHQAVNDVVRISLSAESVYIIRINNKAVKICM